MTVRTETQPPVRSVLGWVVAAVAVVFGLLTVASGGRVLFGGSAVRAAAGEVVFFVLWFNFLAGFFYVAAGLGIARRRRWASRLALAIAVATIAVFAAFGFYILTGGAFEGRTVAAMALRSLVWVAIAVAAHHDARRAAR